MTPDAFDTYRREAEDDAREMRRETKARAERERARREAADAQTGQTRLPFGA